MIMYTLKSHPISTKGIFKVFMSDAAHIVRKGARIERILLSTVFAKNADGGCG